jgi:hypothetical protein
VGSPSATSVRVGSGTGTDEEAGGFFFFLQVLGLEGEGEGWGVSFDTGGGVTGEGWGVPVETDGGLRGKEELEGGGVPEPAAKLAIAGPGKSYGAPASKTLGAKIPGSLSE